jgi:putative ATPase
MAPKSNALYAGYGAAQGDADKTAAEPVPLHLRNPVTSLMKQFGCGKDYQYAHDPEEKLAPEMECLPERLAGRLTSAEVLGHREFVLTRLYESA